MPSPVNTTSTAPWVQAHNPSLSQSQPSPVTQNGTSGQGASQSQDPASSLDNGAGGADGIEALREGKEKAKAVMAASGVNLATLSAQDSPRVLGKPPQTAAEMTNGASPSRKRSRSGSRIPSRTASHDQNQHEQPSKEEYLLHKYIERDMIHSAAMNDQQADIRKLFKEKLEDVKHYNELRAVRAQNPAAVFGTGYLGFGNGKTDIRPARLEYPASRKRAGNRRSRPLHVLRKDIEKQADQLEELIPVRLDIEFDKLKLRDTFTWNLHDRVTPPELFAENLVEDFKIPPETSAPVIQQINREIQEQIQDFYPHVFIEEEPLEPHLPYFAHKNDEMRILIKLNITIGQHTLVDQFEWEINNPLNSPEEFARQMARDLSLSGEFTTAIAHSIREQSQMFTKSLYITGHPFDGRPIEDADVREGFLPSPLPSVFRPVQSAKDYTPVLYELNEADLERTELSILREQRRQKRSFNRRGGPALPDLKDRQRTVRSLVVSSVLPGAAESIERSRLYKLSRAAASRARRAGRVDGGDDSDESDEEDSAPESPAPSLMQQGTARTRGIRGAALAAQGAMRANLERSATPEIAAIQHHETRTSRRIGGYDTREESVAEPTSLIVKLRIPREKYRQWMRAQKARRSGEYQQNHLSTPLMATQSTSQHSTPAASSMPPPPSPAMQQRQTPTASTGSVTASPGAQNASLPSSSQQQSSKYYPDGKADAPYPLPSGAPPFPPPAWLANALSSLREKFPNDSFEAIMRYTAIDKNTSSQVRPDAMPNLRDGAPLPSHIKYMYLPRVRCNDCPGKLYTAGPGLTLENFEVHLRNRQHKAQVEERRRRSASTH